MVKTRDSSQSRFVVKLNTSRNTEGSQNGLRFGATFTTTAETIFLSASTALRAASPSLVRKLGPERDRADKGRAADNSR